MRLADDFRTRWALVGALTWVGLLAVWLERPAGGADTDAWGVVGGYVMFGLPPGVALALFSARYASRTGAMYTLAWIGAGLYALWFAGLSVVLAFVGGLFYCDGVSCETTLARRVTVVGAATATLAACAYLESRMRRRWDAPSAPS